jgi:hypothetical protein
LWYLANKCCPFMNVCRPKSKLISKDAHVIFQFWNPKRKTHKVHMNNAPNNAPSKAFKNYVFQKKFEKQTKCVTPLNL